MNQHQAIALGIATVNIALIVLFPPFDVHSIAKAAMPVFGGFDFLLSRNERMVVNTAVLWLELFVVLINAAIAWLLLRTKPASQTRRMSMQSATLVLVGINLVLIVLFPPFESVYAITRATLPTFEGFYLIFTRQPNHVIVTQILYLEVAFVLVNGALFWLIFRARSRDALTPEQTYRVIQAMRNSD